MSNSGISRRDALKRGVLVGGAVVWAAPTVQALSMTAASAEVPSPTEPPPPPSSDPPRPPEPEPDRTGKVPSHGIFVVTVAGVRYGIKIAGSTFDKIGPKEDNAYLKALGFVYNVPTPAVLALFAGNGGPTTQGEHGTVVTIPAGATLVVGSAHVKDGGLQDCGSGGDKYQSAEVVGGQIFFYGQCHE